jgi:hypothetical protein
MTRVSFLALVLVGCGGTTGGGLVTFNARAGGPADATGAAFEFDTGSGYHVSLASATLHLGAVYLNNAVPSSGGPDQPCVLTTGIYVGEAFANFDLDLLSSELKPFPTRAEGTAGRAVEAEVWLTSGDINAVSDPTPVFVGAGTASRAGASWPFTATVTIGENRALQTTNPAMPGANPICRQRIVSPIGPLDLTLASGGTLDVRVDPRGMFDGVDFQKLGAATVIPDEKGGIGGALFDGVTANSGVYRFTFTNP